MTPEQWRRARDLFERALDESPADLDRWLAAQENDLAVTGEVRSLLAHHTRAGAFLQQPILERLPELLDVEAARFDAGDQVGPYRIVRELGRGGMGHVYLATDTRLGRDVALKVLAPRFVRDASQRERLRREARAAAALTHPGICTVYALEEIGDEVVIASEYAEGQTLRQEIEAASRPSPELLLRTARELAAALAAAHARGITHRDLKPDNVIRTNTGSLKILDFGLAIVDGDVASVGDSPRMTAPGLLIGTPMYMAPEHIENRAVDGRTDLWALGVLLYEYATGVHPFDSSSPLALAARILEAEPVPIASRRPDVPVPVEHVVTRCLRKQASDRFQSAGDVLAALDHAAVATAPSAGVRWWRVHLAVVIALYAIGVAVAWAVLERSSLRAADAAFVIVMVLATTGGVLRGHLLFAERTHQRATFMRELQRSTGALGAVDLLLGVALMVEGMWVATTDAVPGALIMGLGIGIVLTRVILERSTTDVAFGGGAPIASRS